ncbi:hypothetical protein [Streptomyces sp. NPDC051014]|uniref:hypothetical protein n=1 Tax=Streptomyces sp. NPDC051014 TaxID=3155751 RepID=UPI0033FC29A8
MDFLGIAAAGDWGRAASVASDGNFLGQQWDKQSLRALVGSLAPGDEHDEQRIAAELAPWAESGAITEKRCEDALNAWQWLASLARIEWDKAVESAKFSLDWPDCSLAVLSHLVVQITRNPEPVLAARELYRYVLLGAFTHYDLTSACTAIRQARGLASPAQTDLSIAWNSAPQEVFAGSVGDEGSADPEQRAWQDLRESNEQIRTDYDRELLEELDEPDEDVTPTTPVQIAGHRQDGVFSEVPLDGEVEEATVLELDAETAALMELRKIDVLQIQPRNRSVYERYKVAPSEPIGFAVFGSKTFQPVLVFDGFQVPEDAIVSYEGVLRVSEKAGGIGAKAGRFFGAKGTAKFSRAALAGVMTVTRRGATAVDVAELQRLLKQSGITDKKLVERD